MKNNFSVLMSVYYKENYKFLDEALNSIFNQSLRPNQVVLVEDGKLTPELDEIVLKYENKYKKIIKVIKFDSNRGLGKALQDGLLECSNEIVFRMDSDDICRNDRFEKQMKFLIENTDVDVIGSNIFEFKDNINENMRKKVMPIGENIRAYAEKRNPLNHMTVGFKKSAVLECGGYLPMLYLEDYYLWIRMLIKGKKINNINEELVYARIGNGFEKRRGNKSQMVGWKKLQKYMLDCNFINKRRYFANIFNMFCMINCPNFVRKVIYNIFLR